MKRALMLCAALLCISFAARAEENPNPNEQDPMLVFEKRYNFGAQAVLDKNWIEAQRHFEAALAALGQRDNIKKLTAQILAKKAQEESKKQRALFTANELLRLNQFKEAEEAFLAAKADLGETDEIKQGLDAVRARREMDPKLRAQLDHEREYALAMHEAQSLVAARKYEDARIYAERARQLKPDDTRALDMLQEINLRVRGERVERAERTERLERAERPVDPNTRVPRPVEERQKTGDF